jgi:hypothetical protein
MVAAARTKSLASSERDATHGIGHSFGGTYLELVPNERIRSTDEFEDAALPSEIHVTIVLKEVAVGTDLHVLQEGVPDVIPVEACMLGWQDSLDQLAKLVEPEIPECCAELPANRVGTACDRSFASGTRRKRHERCNAATAAWLASSSEVSPCVALSSSSSRRSPLPLSPGTI